MDLAFALERAVPLASPEECASFKGDVDGLNHVLHTHGIYNVFRDVVTALQRRILQRRSSGM